MFEETGPEWLSEEVKTGVSIFLVNNFQNCLLRRSSDFVGHVRKLQLKTRFMNSRLCFSFVCRQPLSP